MPDHLADSYADAINDVTPEVLRNLEFLGIDVLVPIGGDDTLSYGGRLHEEGVPVVAIPKTMDNDVPGTEYCIGFSTCVTRTIELVNRLRTSAGSHERFLVVEVFGRYAGFTALVPAMAGAADRCVIPEHPFSLEHLAELLSQDRRHNPSRYSVTLVSEGATIAGDEEMTFEDGRGGPIRAPEARRDRRAGGERTQEDLSTVRRRAERERGIAAARLPGPLRGSGRAGLRSRRQRSGTWPST